MLIGREVVIDVTLFLICHASLSSAYKILIFPSPVKSHVFPLLAIGEGLIARGHEVTVLLAGNIHVDVTTIGVGQRVERYEDNGTDYEAISEQITAMMTMDEGTTFKQQMEVISQE